MGQLLILHRSGDADDASRSIQYALAQRFGETRVRTLSSGQPGETSTGALHEVIHECIAFIVLIGPKWHTATDAHGQRWLENPADLQRAILEEVLRNPKQLVLPVLVHGAAMPSPLQLPPGLAPLAYRNAASVRPGPTFSLDVERIIRGFMSYVPLPERANYPRFAIACAVCIGYTMIVTGLVYVAQQDIVLEVIWVSLFIVELIWWAVLWVRALILSADVRRWGWFTAILFTGLAAPFMGMLFSVVGPPSRPAPRFPK